MAEKYTATEWATMEGGHLLDTPTQEPFSFIKDLHEARMTKDNGSAKKLTYSDCCERLYLTLLVLETMRHFPDFQKNVQRYTKKTVGFETYKFYRIMGTDLYNFIYFLVLEKLKIALIKVLNWIYLDFLFLLPNGISLLYKSTSWLYGRNIF